MKLPNTRAAKLLGKDRSASQQAAQQIINEPDVDAWQCLIEHSDFIFDYIKDKAGKTLINQVNKDNVNNLFSFLKCHASGWDEHIAGAFAKFIDDEIKDGLLELLQNGMDEEKTYAAKFFSIVTDEAAVEALFKATFCEYQPLKVNSARALGILHDKKSYESYLDKLNSGDDWEKVDAAQFLAAYGDKDALIHILRSMSNSGMAEYLAGEAALLDDICNYFDADDAEYKALSLECFDNILSGLAEIWTLSVLFDFKIYNCIEKLLHLAKESDDNEYTGKYSQLLIKASLKFRMFIEDEEYRFDMDNNVINELKEVNNLLTNEDQEFWDFQAENLIGELHAGSEKRKLAAISLVGEINLKSAFEELNNLITSGSNSDLIISETLQTMKKLGIIDRLTDKEGVIAAIKDENIAAIAKSIL